MNQSADHVDSLAERDQLYDLLCDLTPSEFNEVVRRTGAPKRFMQGPNTPTATRAEELLDLLGKDAAACLRLKTALRVVRPSLAPGDPLAWYREQVRTRFERLDVKGLGQRGRQIKFPLTLDELYVTVLGLEDRAHLSGGHDMATAASRPDGGWERARRAADPDDRAHLGGRGPVPLEEAFSFLRQEGRDRHFRGLVFLGAPGSGKTILLQKLLMTCLDRGSSWMGLPDGLIPVLLPLRRLPDPNTALDRCLLSALEIKDESLHPVRDEVSRLLLQPGSRVLLLLDGLDEVADHAHRQAVVAWIRARLEERPEWRFAVTSRHAGYTAGDLGTDFLEFRIQNFTRDQAREFTQHWFGVVAFHGQPGDAAQAADAGARRSDALWEQLEADDSRAKRLRDMTKNPLLLTCLCLVQLDHGALPHRRSELYELCVGILLKDWQAAKEVNFPYTQEEARALVEPVASWMHQREQRLEASEDELVRGLRWPLLAAFRNPFRLRPFLQNVADLSGLLGSWGGRYAFLHRTFQEYLAARAWRRSGRVSTLAARFDQEWWEEVVLLLLALDDAKGRQFCRFIEALLRRGGWEKTSNLLDACLEEAAAPTLAPFVKALNRTDWRLSNGWRGRTMAALRRWLPENRWPSADPTRVGSADLVSLLRLAERVVRVRPELKDTLQSHALLRAADQLRASADPEVHAAAVNLATSLRGVPGIETLLGRSDLPAGTVAIHARSGIELVFVPGGTFRMGSDEFSDEQPIHRVTLGPFWIGRFPVTNEQYRRFVEDTGHDAPPLWTDEKYNSPHQPVVEVRWHDARAFAEWAGRDPVTEGLGRFELPSESRWEYAARGPEGRRYPWGDQEPTPELANYSESKIGHPTPVGSYPKGVSWCGAEDLAGNVWEWCADHWRDNYEGGPVDGSAWVSGDPEQDTQEDGSGRSLSDNNEGDLDAQSAEMSDEDEAHRVVRGGCWDYDADWLRGACRRWWHPGNWNAVLGFRVVLVCRVPGGGHRQ